MWGSIIAAGAALAGGLMKSHSSNKATDATRDANEKSLALSREQFDFQKDYTKNRIQWQVEDAKKAGLHPMVAAGLSPTSFSPVSYTPTSYEPTDYSWVGDIGQSLNYAATKGKTRKQQGEMLDLQVQGLRLDNEFKQAQIDSLKVDTLASTIASDQAFRSPAAPDLNGINPLSVVGGQNDSVKYVPDEVIASGPNSSVTAGTHPLWTHARSGDFVMPVLSGNLADAVTENKEKNVSAEVSYALSAWNGTLKPPMNAFTAKEKKLLKSGEYSAYYYPFMGWRVEPTLSWKNFKKFVLGGFKK